MRRVWRDYAIGIGGPVLFVELLRRFASPEWAAFLILFVVVAALMRVSFLEGKASALGQQYRRDAERVRQAVDRLEAEIKEDRL